LVLKPEINTTLEFDWFQIDELVSPIYYQTEEPMSPLKGEFAPGVWKLEVWDNRSGPINLTSTGTNDTGTLLSWSLRFVFADSPTAVPLTNGVVYTNTVHGDQIKHFVVAVPNEITQAVNFVLSSGPGVSGVELLYSPFGLPVGQSPPDPLPAQPEAVNFAVNLGAPMGAELPRGRYYYLGVRNFDPAETNDFEIRVNFNIRIVPLANGVWQRNRTIRANTNSFALLRADTTLAVNTMNYYYFDIGSTDIVS